MGRYAPSEGSLRYVARRTATGGFGQLLYALAQQSGLSRAKQIVVLGDGAPWIWKLVAEHFPGAVQIVDLYHAQQHVWEVAHAVFGPGSQDACIWAKQACTLLVHGKIEELVVALGMLPKIAPAADESRSVPEKAVDYFTTNAQRMRYPAFRATSACMWAVALLRRPVKRWLIPAPSELACVGLQMA